MSRRSKSKLSAEEHQYIAALTAHAGCLVNDGQGLARGCGLGESFKHEMFLFHAKRILELSAKQHPELFNEQLLNQAGFVRQKHR